MATTLFLQIEKDELTQLITDAVRAAMPHEIRKSTPQPFIKGIHGLAAFLKVSPARAQKMKNEGVFPFFQDGRTLLFDRDKVIEAMSNLRK